jgi:hypothetical protein
MFPANVGYPPPDTKLPADLIMRFWEEVYGQLQTAHDLSATDAATAITRFRAATDELVGDMLYHRDAHDVADTIATGWENGVVWSPTIPGRTGTNP